MDQLSAVTFLFSGGSFASQFQENFIIGANPFHLWIFTHVELLPMLPALIVVGGLIIVTLSYVSWRKYKGQSQKQRKKQDESVD